MASAYAQKISEPEYIGQVAIVNADSTITVLPTEKTEVKTKSNGMFYIPVAGSLLGKCQTMMIVKGATSQTTVPSSNVKLIVRVDDNNVDPHKKIGFIKFEVKKKERRFAMAQAGTLSGISQKTIYDDLSFKAVKIGTSSYLVTLDKIAPGEYGLVEGETMNIVTFKVK